LAAYGLLVLACYCASTYVLRGRPLGLAAMIVGIAGAMFHDLLLAA
jgi:hypothetical protein